MGFRAYIPVSVSAARQRLKAGAARKILLKKLMSSLHSRALYLTLESLDGHAAAGALRG